jgi:hypothetical protein
MEPLQTPPPHGNRIDQPTLLPTCCGNMRPNAIWSNGQLRCEPQRRVDTGGHAGPGEVPAVLDPPLRHVGRTQAVQESVSLPVGGGAPLPPRRCVCSAQIVQQCGFASWRRVGVPPREPRRRPVPGASSGVEMATIRTGVSVASVRSRSRDMTAPSRRSGHQLVRNALAPRQSSGTPASSLQRNPYDRMSALRRGWPAPFVSAGDAAGTTSPPRSP